MLHILDKYQGIPWVNTIVADRTGHALYADIGAIPNVSNQKAHRCDTALGDATYALLGLPILDGATSGCNWGNDPDAAVPGIFGPSHEPHLFRSDYVTNANDSYWLANPSHPLTGYARIIGTEGTARSLRTRIGLIMTQDRVSGIGEQKGFTLRAMQNLFFSDRPYAGVLWRSQLVSLCKTFHAVGVIPTTSGVTPVGDACGVLTDWDLREDPDSHGAILFRRFVDNLMSGSLSTVEGDTGVALYWQHPFDVSDPVHTPYGLDVADPEVAIALGNAINDLRQADLPLDVAPGKIQGVHRAGHFIPIPGGEGDPNGEFNAIYAPWIKGKGLGDVDDGSSFVQVVTWKTGDPYPVARTILSYSESSDPTDPYYDDQTTLFARKRWIRDSFSAAAIRRNAIVPVVHLAGS